MKKKLPTRTEVLDLVGSDDRPWHAREIAERLEVSPASEDGLHRLLDDMTFDGVLVVRGGQRFKLGKQQAAKGSRERREGTVTINARGFGFVASTAATGDDVFIPGESLGGAMHGDTVVVELVARSSRGAEGQIVEIKARKSQRVSGILRRKGKSAWVEPDDPRVRGPIALVAGLDQVGPEGNSGNDGDVVVVRLTRFPESPEETPEGKLDAVLGRPGEISVEIKKVLLLGDVQELHSEEAVAEAEAFGTEVPKEMLAGREDLTHIPLPTIDPDDARDHDDAVWVERTDKGGWKLWVAIADVSTYVRPGTHLDDEAKKRGTSVYLPDRAIPMLPRALSSNLCSLLPGVTRLCLCVEAELDPSGAVKKVRLIRGVMKSAAKLTYGGVARALGLSELPPVQPEAAEYLEGLKVAHELSRILRAKRLKRGALDFNLPEPVFVLGEDGKATDIKKRTQDPGVQKAYQLIEELMIFANEAVATWLLERELGGVYRVHQPPDEEKLAKLAAMCEVLGVDFDMERTQDPRELSTLLRSFAEHPKATVLNMLLLRSMKQAVYDPSNLGHFGLASRAYLHFTSPIRRYPDLVVHRIVHAALEAQSGSKTAKKSLTALTDPEILSEASIGSSQAERRVMDVERQVADVYRTFFMMDHIGERFAATITSFVGSGAFAAIDAPFVDVMIRTEDMGGDFEISDDGLEAISARSGDAIRLGDAVMVEIVDCAILRRTVYARRIASEGEIARTGGAPRERRGKFDSRSAAGGRGRGRDGGGERGRDTNRGESDTRGAQGSGGGRPAGSGGSNAGGGRSGGKPGGGKPGGGKPGGFKSGGKPGGGKPGGGKPGGGKPGGGKPGGGKPGGGFKGKKSKASKKGTVRGKRR
jgi:ribonuclease R